MLGERRVGDGERILTPAIAVILGLTLAVFALQDWIVLDVRLALAALSLALVSGAVYLYLSRRRGSQAGKRRTMLILGGFLLAFLAVPLVFVVLSELGWRGFPALVSLVVAMFVAVAIVIVGSRGGHVAGRQGNSPS